MAAVTPHGRTPRTPPAAWWDESAETYRISRYDWVETILADPRHSAALTKAKGAGLAPSQAAALRPLEEFYECWPIFLDPPAHTGISGLLKAHLRGRISSRVVPALRDVLTRQLVEINSDEPVDLMSQLIHPAAQVATAVALGFDVAESTELGRWSRAFMSLMDGPKTRDSKWAAGQAALQSLADLNARIDQSSRSDSRGLVQALANTRQRLHPSLAAAALAQAITGGCDPLPHALGNGLLALLRSPVQVRRVRAHPDLIGRAISEMLRFDCPFRYITRTAGFPFTLGTANIRAGQRMRLMISDANHDSQVFRDANRFDVARRRQHHLAFGHPRRYCPGASLTRLFMTVVLSELLSRFQSIHLDSGAVERRSTMSVHGVDRLPVLVRHQ